MLFFCGLNVLAMCSSRILKLVSTLAPSQAKLPR